MALEMSENQALSTPPPGILADKPVPAADGTLSKGKFAEFINVTAGRVSQYIGAGKLTGDALVGEGRSARIHVARAVAQLKNNLDIGQRLGNGIDTKLDAPSPPQNADAAVQTAPSDPSPSPPVDTVEAQIKAEALRERQFRNRRLAEDEAARAGHFTDTESVKLQLGRLAGQMLVSFEGALTDLATALAAQFKLPQRDVLHALRAEFRNIRSRAADSAGKDADALPALVPALGEDAEPLPVETEVEPSEG